MGTCSCAGCQHEASTKLLSVPNLASPPRLLGIGNSSSLSPRRRFLQFLSSHCKQARINTGSVHFINAHCAFVVYYYTIDRVYPLGALFPLFEHSFFLTNFFLPTEAEPKFFHRLGRSCFGNKNNSSMIYVLWQHTTIEEI